MLTFFVVVLVLIAAGALVWIGYELASGQLSAARHEVEQQKQALKSEWKALDQTRRVRAVFLAARRAMQAEAYREGRR